VPARPAAIWAKYPLHVILVYWTVYGKWIIFPKFLVIWYPTEIRHQHAIPSAAPVIAEIPSRH
jgi:hypothetical protein